MEYSLSDWCNTDDKILQSDVLLALFFPFDARAYLCPLQVGTEQGQEGQNSNTDYNTY